MSTEVLAPRVRRPARPARPGVVRLVTVLSGHAILAFLRAPAAMFFTLVFPVSFLVIVGSIVGGQRTPDGTRVSQYLVAPFAVFGVAEGAFCVLAIGFATLRDSGVLKRLRGTPVPAGAVLASRVIAAVVMSALSVLVLVVVGWLGYGVRPLWTKMPAAAVTLLLGMVCCAALGLAVVALTRSVLAVQALTNGVLIPLAFISNVFIVGVSLPTGIDWVSRALPLRHFADALAGTFDPAQAGLGFAWSDLAALAGWAAAGIAVAAWRFGWEPRGRRTAPAVLNAAADRPAEAVATAPVRLEPARVGRPSAARLVLVQLRYALTALIRERLPVFFAVVFPGVLLVLFPAVLPPVTVHGLSMADAMLPGMLAYAVAVAGYVNLPEAVAQARGAGVLERLRGTPLPPWAYLAGRLGSGLVVSTLAAAVLMTLAALVNGYHVDAARLPATALAIVLSALCFGALGLALLTLMPAARTVTAVTLGTLVPLSFVSDVFYVGAELPAWLQRVGDLFPLKPAAHAFLAAVRPDAGGPGFAWTQLALLGAWAVVGLALTARKGTFLTSRK